MHREVSQSNRAQPELPLIGELNRDTTGQLTYTNLLDLAQVDTQLPGSEILSRTGNTVPADASASKGQGPAPEKPASQGPGAPPILANPFRQADSSPSPPSQTAEQMLAASRAGTPAPGGSFKTDRTPSLFKSSLSDVPGRPTDSPGRLTSQLGLPGWTPVDKSALLAAALAERNQVLNPKDSGDKKPGIEAAKPGKDVASEAKENLLNVLKKFSTKTSSEFQSLMTEFETRCTSGGLSRAEIAGTYAEVQRVLQSDVVKRLCAPEKLANEILRNAAHPTKIDQGQHPTCNVTSYECRLYTLAPSQAARLVASVATSGQFTCTDGTVIRPRSIKPDDEAALAQVPDGYRNYASQIFQNTAINIYWNRRAYLPDLSNVGRGNIQYCQSTDKKGELEYLLDCSKDPPVKFSFKFDAGGSDNSPRIGQKEIVDINEQITGTKAQDLGIERGMRTRESDGILYVGSLDDLKGTLRRLKSENKFPVLLSVDVAMKPFSNGDKAETSYLPHLVTVTDYDPENELVSVDNQWGSRNDFTGKANQQPRIPTDQLWESMRTGNGDGLSKLWKATKANLASTTLTDVQNIGLSAMATSAALRGTFGNATYEVQLALWNRRRDVKWCRTAYDFTCTRSGGLALRAATALPTIALACAFNDVPGAFMKSPEEGTGKLFRATGQAMAFEGGVLAGEGLMHLTRLKFAPGRIGLAVTLGVAAAVVLDRAGGDYLELGGRLGGKALKHLVTRTKWD